MKTSLILTKKPQIPRKIRKFKRKNPLTVCIAAICMSDPIPDVGPLPMIIGATDRTITGGDIEFEPQIANKIFHFSVSVSGMFAGDFGMQTEIVQRLVPIVIGRIKEQPQNWWLVKDVAELYAKLLKETHLKRAENSILAPLGLDLKSFLANQKEMDADLVKQLISELKQFASPGVESIFCGLDVAGTHIYVVDNSANVVSHDVVGFAAIGAGYWHSNSQFMFSKHNWRRPLPETLLLTYSAKKHAEVAPGVGSETDMFIIGPGMGKHTPAVGEHVLDKLQEAYLKTQKQNGINEKKAQAEMSKFIEEITKKAAMPDVVQIPPTTHG